MVPAPAPTRERDATHTPHPNAPVNPYLALVVATFAVSCSAILIEWSSAPPITLAAWRMGLTTLIVAVLTRRSGVAALSQLTRRQHGLLVLSGISLALHFALWTASLRHTSVASSVLFVSLHPAVVAVVAWIFLREKTAVSRLWGVVLAIIGSALLAGGDIRLSGDAAWGDLLALGGGLVFAAYLVVGRNLRAHLGSLAYTLAVYGWCWVILSILALVSGEGLSPRGSLNLLLFLALAVIPTLAGHSVFNWALRYLQATIISVSFLGEPIFAGLLAWALLGQAISVTTASGGLLVLGGMYLTARKN